MLLGDVVGMIEIETVDADRVGTILEPLAGKVAGRAVVSDWRQMNASLFEALAVERVAMFVVLSIIVLVALVVFTVAVFGVDFVFERFFRFVTDPNAAAATAADVADARLGILTL